VKLKMITKMVFLLLVFLFPASLYADSETKTVEVTGEGNSKDEAVKNGLRSAVEKAVGTMISSKTYVSNNMLIEDNILSYASGYIEDYQIKAFTDLFGHCKAVMDVKVASLKLNQKLDSLNIAKTEIAGQKFAVQVESKMKAEKDAAKMIQPVLDKFPQVAYVATVDAPALVGNDDDEATVKISYHIRFDSTWMNEFEQTLSGIALGKVKSSGIEDIMNNYDAAKKHSIVFARNRNKKWMYGRSIRENDWGTGTGGFVVPEKSYKSMKDVFTQALVLKMTFYSDKHEVVAEKNVTFKPNDNFGFLLIPRGGSYEQMMGGNGVTSQGIISSCFGLSFHKDYNGGGEIKMQFSVADLKQIATVECYFMPLPKAEPFRFPDEN